MPLHSHRVSNPTLKQQAYFNLQGSNMSKVATVFVIFLLFCSSLSYAARPAPVLHDATPVETHPQGVHEVEVQPMDMEERCGAGDEECLMRRTLAAHLDYIYTQKHKP